MTVHTSAVRKYLDGHEWFPVFTLIDDAAGYEVELPSEDFADYERVMGEFDAWQERLGKMHGEAETGKAEAEALAHVAESTTVGGVIAVNVEVTAYVYDGPGPDANLLGVFQPGEAIAVDAPRVWVQYR